MIARRQAVAYAARCFPFGPEKLAKHLHVRVVCAALKGCDGWCLKKGGTAIITLNERSSLGRQRFTLAHELAHLLLGTDGEIVAAKSGPFKADTEEEKAANGLAAELLLPLGTLRSIVQSFSLPLDGVALDRIARVARVSQTMGACRVAGLAGELGLTNAAVLGYEGRQLQLKWTWSDTLAIPNEFAFRLLTGAAQSCPGLCREDAGDGNVFCASLIRTTSFSAVFVQLLPAAIARRRSLGERRKQLEDWIFGSDTSLRNHLNGRFSSFNTLYRRQSDPSHAAVAFLQHYRDKWDERWARKIEDKRVVEWLTLKFAITPGK